MTLEELENVPGEMLLSKHVAPLLGVAPYSVTLQARECPERLGFPVVCIGSRVKIPKRPFIKFMRGE